MFETINKPSNLTEALLPILICNWAFGHQMIQCNQNNFVVLQKFFYFAFIISIYIITWGLSIVFSVTADKATYQENIYWIVIGVNALIFCINIILGLIFRNKARMIHIRCMKADKKLEDLGVPVNNQRSFSYSLITTVIWVVTAILLNLMTILWNWDIEDIVVDNIIVCTFHHPIYMNYLIDLTFCLLVHNMGMRFRKINKALLKFTVLQSNDLILTKNNKLILDNRSGVCNQTPSRLSHSLHILKNIHLELTTLCEKITNIFGVQIIMTTVSSFTLITSVLYDLYLTVKDPRLENNEKMYEGSVLLSWVVVNIINFQFINFISAQTVQEWDRTNKIIHKLESESQDTELCSTIQKFALQMLQNPLKFSPCGFIDLGYPFVREFAGTITTYLIILIQMPPN
ncbi:gustatory receptor for sugar taste 43a-like [Microplitis mediator]|uniref:gustatory receptor for sugar taste 43a-like n=1 Tax=Microplitis mediator TaxID=375433 RepID=UPI0025564193|nr:gustatory receptor for sugar taste 43a-like [Microplitis mediator]